MPLREQLDQTDLRIARLTGADLDQRTIRIETVDGRDAELGYDHLILALGSVARTLPVPGLAEHAVGFKTIAEAISLRNRVIQSFEIAESCSDPEEARSYLSYVFVGAGYAGVEALAELQDFAADVINHYPRCRVQGMRWVLIEAQDRIMQEVTPDLAAFTTRELRARGIEVRTQTRLDEVTDAHAKLSDGEIVPSRTLAWTAGVKPPPLVGKLGLPLGEHGRIQVDRYMQVDGRDDVWAIGDAAAVPDPARKGQPCPQTAQHSMRQGRRVARNVAAALGTGRKRPFTYKTKGLVVDLGRHQAVASIVGIKLRGFPAWFVARTYHMLLMPGMSRRLRLIADWTVDLLFGRDSAELGETKGHPSLEVDFERPAAEREDDAPAQTAAGGTRT